MVRSNNYTTILLVTIVIILLLGVAIALYYVLDLDWFEAKPVDVYNEQVTPYVEPPEVEVKIEKEIKYDVSKRTYNLVLNTNELKIVVYKDGTVGVTMIENEKYKSLANYNELLSKETKPTLTNIIRAYEVKVSKDETPKNFIVLLDSEGNLYELVEKELLNNGKYAFVKIEGMAKVIDVKQITNDGLTENTTGFNAIAIDEESNELLLTDYLIKNS